MSARCWAVIPAGTVWNARSGATASNLNSGGFDTGATFQLTDGVGGSATGNNATLSSGTYSFTAADVTAGAWVYIVSNTGVNVNRGFCQIASQSSGVATLNTAVGQCIWHNATTRTYTISTSAGISSTAAPTSITFGIDYSQSTAALCAITDLVIDGTTNTDVTSAGCPFGKNHVGNSIRVASGTGFTVQVAVIASIPSGVIARLEKSAGTLSSTAGVAKLGGSLSLGTSDDGIFEASEAGNDWFVENGSYTIGGTVSLAKTGSATSPIRIMGYNTKRGDNPTGSTRPILNVGANAWTAAANWDLLYTQPTGTGTITYIMGSNNRVMYNKITNTSTTAGRHALTNGGDGLVLGNELVSYRGRAIQTGQGNIVGNYIHDSDVCINVATVAVSIIDNLIAGCVTSAIDVSSANSVTTLIAHNTIYGAENQRGTGINLSTGTTDVRIISNIIAGFATGISHADPQTVGADLYNAYYNNGADTNANWALGRGSLTGTNPTFTNVVQRTNTTATTTAGNHLVQSGATFQTWGITAGVDYVYTSGGTGVTAGAYAISSLDSETQITVDVTLSANATADKTWFIRQGHNFAIGTGLKALGFPGIFPGGLTTGFTDIGGAQRLESGTGQKIY